MNESNIFHKDMLKSEKDLEWQKTVGYLFKIISLGFYRNERNISKAYDNYNKCKDLYKEYTDTISDIDKIDVEIYETNIFDTIRIGQQQDSPISVIDGETYPPNWDLLREEVLLRDNYECQESDGFCFGSLQIHHKVPLSKGGTNKISNLATLCKYHHTLKHPHMRRRL